MTGGDITYSTPVNMLKVCSFKVTNDKEIIQIEYGVRGLTMKL